MMETRPRGLLAKHGPTIAEVDWAAAYADQLPRVYNYFRFRVGDDLLAEELTAQTFERAWRERGRYRSDLGAFSTWLFTIARHLGMNHRRDHRAARELPLEWVTGLHDRQPVEDLVEQRENLGRLRLLLARLPATEQELIRLKYGAGLTNRAIARLIGLSESNVGTRLHRTVQRLRADWEEER